MAVDIGKLLEDLGDSLDKNTKEFLLKNQDEIKDLGKQRFLEILQAIKEGRQEEVSVELQMHLLEQLSDEDFLKLKKNNIEAIKLQAELQQKRRDLAEKYLDGIKNVSVSILSKYLMAALL